MALIIASPVTPGSEIVSTMATTTSALVIAIVIIIVASMGVLNCLQLPWYWPL